jgi:SNF2 family DNA or RNA helicase
LFLECGAGKTLVTLSAFYDLNPHGHVLVIAPKNIARSTWTDEIKKWKFPLRTCSFVCNEKGKDLKKAERMKLYEDVPNQPPTVYFINRELFKNLVDNMPVINGVPTWYFPNIVIDESQSFKSHKSERFKAMKRIRPCVNRVVELTGTPTPKGLMDLWSQIYILDMGQRLGPNITSYRNTFFFESKHANGFPVDWSPLPGMEDRIHQLVSDITVSIENPNIQLPPVQYNDITIKMDPPELNRYKQFMKDKVLTTLQGKEITASNAAVLQAKLAQMASGTLYIDEEHHYEEIHDKKLLMLSHIVEQAGSPVLIAYWFNCDKERILKQIPGSVCFDGSTQMLHDWNDKKIPVMLIHPASAGFGLNFQEGGHILVWYTLPWSLENYVQTCKRIDRQGQTQPVIIHRLLTEGTVDRHILHTLNTKDVSERALLNAVAATIQDSTTIT